MHALPQETRIAFWKSLDSYDGQSSSLGTWLHSVAMNTARGFKRQNRNSRKIDAGFQANAVWVEQDRSQLRILEEFMGILGDLDRKVFTMYLDLVSYGEMSASLGLDEAALRKRMSRIKEQFKAKYGGR